MLDQNKNNYLGYVHSFRGFAILNIVAVHAIAVAVLAPAFWAPDKTSVLYVASETLFHDSTIYFALISGLLFAAILRERGFARFYRNKALYVIAPYVVCTLVFSVFRWKTDGTGVLAVADGFAGYLSVIPANLLLGEAQFTYWYIPIILILFALTPLFDSLVRARSVWFVPAVVLMLLPLIFSRPPLEEGFSQVHPGTVVYFGGAYLFGMYLGERLEQRLDALSSQHVWVLAVAIISSAALVAMQLQEIDYIGGISMQESLYYVQKLALAVIVLLWLRQRAERQPQFLAPLADSAFSIYFLHIFFMLVLAHLFWDTIRNPDWQPWSMYLAAPVYFISGLVLSLLVVRLLRRIVGSKSRLLIGS